MKSRGKQGPADTAGSDDGHRLQDRMMQVSRLATLGEMAAGVAHELNQPLTAISNYARACERILQREKPELDEVLEAIREIGLEAGRAGQIIRRVRGLVADQPSERTLTDLNELVSELGTLVQTDARVHDVRLRIELGNPLPSVVIDRVQIQHALLNLLRNSLEALDESPAGPREVVIRTVAVDGGDVELSVADSGPGVAPHVLERLFVPFVTTKPHGTGLGLVTSQSIVRAHDGTLAHRQNTPQGACFFMRIPSALE
jgi:two-component system sensor kinase FixL